MGRPKFLVQTTKSGSSSYNSFFINCCLDQQSHAQAETVTLCSKLSRTYFVSWNWVWNNSWTVRYGFDSNICISASRIWKSFWPGFIVQTSISRFKFSKPILTFAYGYYLSVSFVNNFRSFSGVQASIEMKEQAMSDVFLVSIGLRHFIHGNKIKVKG